MEEKQRSMATAAIACMLATVMLMMFCFPSTVVNASTYPERVVKMLIAYDDSYSMLCVRTV